MPAARAPFSRHRHGMFTIPYPTLSYPALPTLPYPTLPYPTLPYPTLPYSSLPYPTLPHPALPYPTLPYSTLPYREAAWLRVMNEQPSFPAWRVTWKKSLSQVFFRRLTFNRKMCYNYRFLCPQPIASRCGRRSRASSACFPG